MKNRSRIDWRCFVWVGVLCLLNAGIGEAADAPSVPVGKRDATASREAAGGEPKGDAPDLLNVPGLSRGVDAIIAEIRKREVEIALREQRVAERERAVVELEAMIEKRSVELDRIRQEVEDRILEWTTQGQDRTAQLASVYSSMPPARAGELLGKLELDLAVSVIRGMKKKPSAAVLAAMRPDRALLVTRRLLKPLDPRTDVPAAKRN